MGFRDREKRRLAALKPELFTVEACEWGSYGDRTYEFCLRDNRAKENLHGSIRDEALRYFRECGIKWHDGIGDGPSNHLCCSQSCCANFWMPFVHEPSVGTVLNRAPRHRKRGRPLDRLRLRLSSSHDDQTTTERAPTPSAHTHSRPYPLRDRRGVRNAPLMGVWRGTRRSRTSASWATVETSTAIACRWRSPWW